jgi:hypothetical protein
MNRNTTLLLVVALAGMTAACDDMDIDLGGQKYEAPFHYGFDVHPGARLDLETFNGAVEIHSWDQNKVDISGTKFANSTALRDSIKIDATGTPDSVTVRAIRPPEHHGSMGAKFVVHVPKNIILDHITNSNGGVRIDGVDGSVNARTSNGAIHVEKVNGPVEATTSNGSIEVTDATGNLMMHTSNGHIQADHVTGTVEAESSNGSITLNFTAAPKNNVHATTSNSSIEISLPESAAVRVRASTSNGSISSDYEVAQSGDNSKNHLEGAIHGGGPLLDLETSNGSIKIVKP